MPFLASFVDTLRNFYLPFPRLPKNTLRPLVPFIAWYVFLRGLLIIINGLRDLSLGLRYNSLPQMFTTLLDVLPVHYVISGSLSVLAGLLYLKAYMSLSRPATRLEGWQKWAVAAASLTAVRLYEVVFVGLPIFWFILVSLVGWYFIFEFERTIKLLAAAKKPRVKRKPSTRK